MFYIFTVFKLGNGQGKLASDSFIQCMEYLQVLIYMKTSLGEL